jgi:hypothetical protein
MLTPQQAMSEKNALIQIFNPKNPDHVKRLKELTYAASGGKQTIKTARDMEGTGYYDPRGMYDFGGSGFTYTETEQEKQKMNPNSAEFRKIQAKNAELSRRRQDELKRYGFSAL